MKLILKKEKPERIAIICKHCRQLIRETRIMGISLICPHCGKPGN